MSTKVCELDELSGWLDVEGKCNGEFVSDVWDNEYTYCRVVDITIENIKRFGIVKPTLVIYFQKDEKEEKEEKEGVKENER